MGKIILTDYPKTKSIKANVRGLTTEELHKWDKQLFHLMMCSMSEVAGGYCIEFDYKDIMAELKWRKEPSIHDREEKA